MSIGQVGQMTIVKAELVDFELINRMAWVAFPHTYREMLSKEQIEYMMHWMYDVENLKKQMQEQKHEYFIAYCDNAPAGYISIRPDREDCYHLEKIYVMPDFQRKHYGDTMFDFVVEYIKSNYPEIRTLELNVNRDNSAVNFYRRKGMRIDHQGDFHIGHNFYMNDYIMRLDF